MKKSLLKIIILAVCLIFISEPVKSLASDSETASHDAQSFAGYVMTLSEDATAYTSADETSEAVQNFSAGDSVFVVGEQEGWYQIYYKGETLYITDSSITQENVEEAQKEAEELSQGLKEEQEALDKRAAAEIEAFERENRSQRNAKIWKIVIGVLVMAIIAVSIVIGIKNKKMDEEDKEAK